MRDLRKYSSKTEEKKKAEKKKQQSTHLRDQMAPVMKLNEQL